MKLNDIFYMAKRELETYYQTSERKFLINSIIYYMDYKKKGGKKLIERLEEVI